MQCWKEVIRPWAGQHHRLGCKSDLTGSGLDWHLLHVVWKPLSLDPLDGLFVRFDLAILSELAHLHCLFNNAGCNPCQYWAPLI